MAKPGKSWDQTLDNMYNIVHWDEQESAPMIDPIAYRSDYRPEDIKADWRSDPNIPWVWPKWANEHFNEYWDDSNPSWQGFKWWLNEKYTGEWVKTSMVDYDPNITTAWLNPNYMFWDAARNSDTKESWYLAKRNDMIASALYNEWKVSREDVANYLSAQKWWFDSTEADRQNTIESIYKRLWQLSPEQQKKADEWKADNIVKDNSWELYGKTTAEEWNPKEWIQTLADANSPFTAMEQARADNLKSLISMPPQDIATALDNWLLPWDLQSIRDLQQFYPEIWDEVKQYQKKTKAQNVVNSITTWWDISTENNGQSVINNSIADFSNKNAWSVKSSQEITADVNNALAQNQTANEASETMASIESDMAVLKNRLKNIRAEATAAFKWDVPDYLVNAYIANKSQEIQNQMQILEDRYNMAFNRYKTEVANTQWEQEMKLKQDEFALKQKYYELEKWQAEQWTSSTKSTTDTSIVKDDNWNQIAVKNDEDLAAVVDWLLSDLDYWKLWNAQCAAWIQKYYFPKIWISIWNLSSIERKRSLINEGKGYKPKKWDLIILNSKSAPENWHIWIVIWVNGDYVEYLDWNGSIGKDWKGTEKAAINSTKLSNTSILWYRNVNKGQDGIYGAEWETISTDKQWSDSDYSAFEKFLDSKTSATDRKQLAEEFWMDVKTMRETAEKALQDRNSSKESDEKETIETPKWEYSTDDEGRVVLTKPDWTTVTYAYWVSADDPRIKESWFDPELWFNPNMKDIYEKVLLNTDKDDSWNWLANREEFHQREKWQLWQEANAYANAKKEWYDAYNDELRNVDKTYWFAVDKKDVYEDMNKALAKWWTIANTVKNWFIERLWLNKKDENAWQKASDELANYNKWSKEIVSEMDWDLNDLLWAYEYIIMQDATKPQRNAWISIWEADTWNKAYELVTWTEIFDKLINTKSQWWTLTPVSDRDMEMIRSASTAIDKTLDSDSFKNRVNYAYKRLRESIWNPIEQKDLDKMWNQEWKSKKDFSDYLVIDHAHRTWIFWWVNKYSSESVKKKDDANPWGNWAWTWPTTWTWESIIDPDDL